MEQAEGECQRSAERMRYLFAALTIGVAPLALFFLGAVASLVPFADGGLEAVPRALGVLGFILLLPAQFVVIHKAGNSMRLRDSDRLVVGAFCALFSVAPVVTVMVLAIVLL
jgi:hypothetical protein